jgi:hypothetical protein
MCDRRYFLGALKILYCSTGVAAMPVLFGLVNTDMLHPLWAPAPTVRAGEAHL